MKATLLLVAIFLACTLSIFAADQPELKLKPALDAITPDGLLALTLVQTRKPQEGKLIVRLSESPIQLRGWSILDNRGNKVDVTLTDLKTGMQLAGSLFKYDGPDAGQIMRGGNRN